jgi:hypothetical protein
MASIICEPGCGYVNISPDAFHRWAIHYQKCKHDFQCPHPFSPVPYFLLCRAIELELKARHLKYATQKDVKDRFRHNLLKAYEALDPVERILNPNEERTLRDASSIYCDKNEKGGFEYFNPEDALTAYKRYPDLTLLDAIASKLIGI